MKRFGVFHLTNGWDRNLVCLVEAYTSVEGRTQTTLARYRVWDGGVAEVKDQGMLAEDADKCYAGYDLFEDSAH